MFAQEYNDYLPFDLGCLMDGGYCESFLSIEHWNGTSALGWAIKRKEDSIAKVLSVAGADKNMGNPVLVNAVNNNSDVAYIEKLIKKGW